MYTFDHRTRDSAGAFLVGELERLDLTLNLPLTEVTWQRDIDLREDVAIEDETASFTRSHFAAAGFAGAGKSWIGDNSTAIQGIGLDITKHPLPLHLWGLELGWSTIELNKAQRLGRPIDTQKYEGMKLKYQMDADEMVYLGDTSVGAVGLINNPAVAPYNMQVNWATASADEILKDINLFIEHAWKRAGYVVAPDQLRLAPDRFALLVRPVSEAGSISILDYVSKQCVSANKNGRPLEIA
ncbi:major capsid family protein, partial [Telmatospirillum sp. J64-1]|uniref:major capsid family protein n=1 Tax=Telmatospirillum sp. J64-1 TaxID=2502183 RepID=UPI0021026943